MITLIVFLICLWLNIEYETLVTLFAISECFIYMGILALLLGRK